MVDNIADIVIIGSGVAAVVATRIGASLPIVAYSAAPPSSAIDNHHAVLRLKDSSSATVLGCRAVRVMAHRMALHCGKLIEHSDVGANNEYSIKVYGELRDCSILHLGRVERYLISPPAVPSGVCKFKQRLVGLSLADRTLTFEDTDTREVSSVRYRWCISTIPMPVMARLAGVPCSASFICLPIGVRRYTLHTRSSICQTLYVPSRDYQTYRITIHNQEVMVEHVISGHPYQESEVEDLIGWLGVGIKDLELVSSHIQEFGKIIPIEEMVRKRIMYQLTSKANVVSLGRYATWKSLRVEDVVEDAVKAFNLVAVRDEHEAMYCVNREEVQR